MRYGLAGGLAEVVVLLCGPFLGLAILLTPAMILWINMVTHGLPGVAFGAEPLDPSQTRRPSAPGSVLNRTLVRQIVFAGTLVTTTSLIAGAWASWQGHDARTAVFLTLGLGQLAVALALRSPRGVGGRRWRWSERSLELAARAAGACQVAGVTVPVLSDLLGTQWSGSAGFVVPLCLASVPGFAVALLRRRGRDGRRSRLPRSLSPVTPPPTGV